MNKNEVISEETYFDFLSDDNLNEEEQKDIDEFEEQMLESMKYHDYLVGDHKDNYDKYEFKISTAREELQLRGENTPFSKRQIKAIEKYKQMDDLSKEFNEQKRSNEYKKVLKKDVKSGYINAFIVVLSILFTGILLGFALFLGM